VSGEVTIGDRTTIGAHCNIQGPTVIGEENRIFGQAAIGTDPQDLKYAGERTTLEIGDRNQIREFVTINRGTGGGLQKTLVGSENLLMTGVHIAHDCLVGSKVILANAATLAGHVEIQDGATVGAFSGVHQFCRVGVQGFVGGYSVITRDALPFIKTVGARNQASIYGVNSIGLERRGVPKDRIATLQKAYRILFQKGLSVAEAVAEIHKQEMMTKEVKVLLAFIESSERGFVRTRNRNS